MKSGLFKKILSSENDDTAAVEVPPAPATSNPFTTSPAPAGPQGGRIPPVKNPDPLPSSGDPFEDDRDFGFEAGGEEPEPAPANPTFAVPEEKQLAAPAATTPVEPEKPEESTTADEPIRQLELRAIFGVDHDMGEEEILERARKLKGIRHLNRLADGDAGTIEALKAMVSRFGLRGDSVRIFAGTAPIDFIRDGTVTLAVQTDGSFAPGVRETLILVARELGKS